MQKKMKNYSAPNFLAICVDGHRDMDISGRLYYGTGEIPERFLSAKQMILKIDALCDRIGYPQSSTVARTFAQRETETSEEKVMEMVRPEIIAEQQGEEATFVVHVKYRQNATWQGSITWAEKDMTHNFRSALELLKLIDSALYEQEDETVSARDAG